MPYTLWSRGRLLGYTDLDIPCVQSFIRQGFIEPTDVGRPLLADAAGVPAVCAALNRERRQPGRRDEHTLLDVFRAACDRRESLQLELRDEDGNRVEVEWIQVNDLQADPYDAEDTRSLIEGEDVEVDEEFEAAIQADLEAFAEDLESEAWKGEQESDPRWDTMQYHMMVYLPGSRDGFDGSERFL